jgi:hypothetical protein
MAGPWRRSVLFLLVLTLVVGALPAVSARASEDVVPPGHTITFKIPDKWEQLTDFKDPILVAAVEPGTGNSLGLLSFKQDEKFTLVRKSAEAGVLKELGAKGKILRTLDTKLAGAPAYCVIAEVELQGKKVSIARIMAEKPLNGFVYVVQYSKLDGGEIDDAAIKSIAERLTVSERK